MSYVRNKILVEGRTNIINRLSIFSQGYFLLHHLAMMVGRDEFDTFLFSYVQHYSGQLVSSEVRTAVRFNLVELY